VQLDKSRVQKEFTDDCRLIVICVVDLHWISSGISSLFIEEDTEQLENVNNGEFGSVISQHGVSCIST